LRFRLGIVAGRALQCWDCDDGDRGFQLDIDVELEAPVSVIAVDHGVLENRTQRKKLVGLLLEVVAHGGGVFAFRSGSTRLLAFPTAASLHEFVASENGKTH